MSTYEQSEHSGIDVEYGASGQNDAALLALMERTGYVMLQENGQRKYGPPPDWVGPPPPRGCEIFVGKIPRDCYEDELVPAFERIGKIYEFRLMMDFSGSNRGYSFVTYTNREDARAAIARMNNYEIRPDRFLGVCASVDNCRLFIGGILKNKTQEEILEEMKKITEGVTNVIVYPSSTDKSKHRGFAFVEYVTHRAAAMARRKLVPGRIHLWGHQIAVDWAEPEQEVDDEGMSQMKILHVRNLPDMTEENIQRVFNEAAGHPGAVERIRKIRDSAAIHFYEHRDALRALHYVNSTCGMCGKASLSKTDVYKYMNNNNNCNQYPRTITNNYNNQMSLPPLHIGSYQPNLGMTPNVNVVSNNLQSGMCSRQELVDNFSGLSLAADSSSQYRNGAGTIRMMAAGRPGLPPPPYMFHDCSVMNAANKTGVEETKYAPEGVDGGEFQGCETNLLRQDSHVPGSIGSEREVAQQSMMSRRGAGIIGGEVRTQRSTVPGVIGSDPMHGYYRGRHMNTMEILSELCRRYDLGIPEYQPESTVARDGSGDVQLFACKVKVPRLLKLFSSSKLSHSVEDAHLLAAEQALRELSLIADAGGLAPVRFSPTTTFSPASGVPSADMMRFSAPQPAQSNVLASMQSNVTSQVNAWNTNAPSFMQSIVGTWPN